MEKAKLYNNEWDYAVDKIATTIHELEILDPLLKMKLMYTFIKIYSSESNLDNICLTLDKERITNEKQKVRQFKNIR